MVKRIALVCADDGAVVNVCVWDGVTPWNDIPPGVITRECPDEVGPGWTFSGDDWNPPPPTPDAPPESPPEG